MGTTRSAGKRGAERSGYATGNMSGRSDAGGSGRQSMLNTNLDPFMGYSIQDLGGGRIQIGAPSNRPGLGNAIIKFGEEAAVDYEGNADLISMLQNKQGQSSILKNIFAKYRTAGITKEEGDRRTFFKEQREQQLKETPGDRFTNALGSSLLTSKGGLL